FNQTLVNPTNVDQTASYSVTATTAGCSASTFIVLVSVNPKPVGSATITSTQPACSVANNVSITFSETSCILGTIDYSWTRDNVGNVGGMATSGFGTPVTGTLTNTTNTAQTTRFFVTASSEYGCESDE